MGCNSREQETILTILYLQISLQTIILKQLLAKVERLGFVFSIKSFFFAASKQGAFILCYIEKRAIGS